MTLKLDVSKAYDKVEWSFLEQVMSKLGFGDPLSLYLFLLCTKAFNTLLQHAEDEGRLRAIEEINFSKSLVAYSRNTKEEMCQALTTDLTIQRENKTKLYLGLTSSVARTKRAMFATIQNRIWRKISGWNEKLLSQAGKGVLIKGSYAGGVDLCHGMLQITYLVVKGNPRAYYKILVGE
ncbi:hypothetical protein Sango_2421200 [Sesamum angolense]|uniref:Reverse transcriptase n=1 Tax=Sesamum angolense TaxID=2727404 RepID=A0AAE2BJY2_9LAMI|nr:hypothetical protein Sango_2421200 [Sesamum angolense]